eukprot:TRINITY_DN4059_c0_g1_i1.p1 TRINITY_DN4059_c0_g1~~TRINITY_DN4059_c0_g1_i1.p1  ORF type:complete len:201 (-),score=47.81 TRINITY_DN4059_c0_g1_i1:181-783(-)
MIPLRFDYTVHATTILSVRKGNKTVMIGDGQVSLGETIVKANAKKVRKIGPTIVAGFAGSAADGMTLIERLEERLAEYPGQLVRASVELAKLWRTDKMLRPLQAMMIVADEKNSLSLSGNGDVLEHSDGVVAIGSGGIYALSAARALIDIPDMDAEQIARKSMNIAADICVFTNKNFTIEIIEHGTQAASDTSKPTENST